MARVHHRFFKVFAFPGWVLIMSEMFSQTARGISRFKVANVAHGTRAVVGTHFATRAPAYQYPVGTQISVYWLFQLQQLFFSVCSKNHLAVSSEFLKSVGSAITRGYPGTH